jgi:peroxiredoxin
MVSEHSVEKVSTAAVLGKGRNVLFGVPAAFSPTCSDRHLPGFVLQSGEILDHGVDRIFCVSVNDSFVMTMWARSQRVGDKVTLLADGNGELARAMGVEIDLSVSGLGIRNKRYAAVLDEGVITHLLLEEGTGLEVSSAEGILAALS